MLSSYRTLKLKINDNFEKSGIRIHMQNLVNRDERFYIKELFIIKHYFLNNVELTEKFKGWHYITQLNNKKNLT